MKRVKITPSMLSLSRKLGRSPMWLARLFEKIVNEDPSNIRLSEHDGSGKQTTEDKDSGR